MKNQIEFWKDVVGYEGSYQVSNLGNIKSLSRLIMNSGKYPIISKERILKPGIDTIGYNIVVLRSNNKSKTRKVHQLVCESFLNHTPCGHKLVVNHKDLNKLNNHVDNLEIITQRENVHHKQYNTNSKSIGVGICNKSNKWRARINLDNKRIYLGRYETEVEAHNAYQKALQDYLSLIKKA